MQGQRMKVAFICTGNTARSQIAEAYGRYFAKLYGKELEVYSAGARPEGEINPLVIEVMKEEGFDLSGFRPKGLEEIPLRELDLIITLCDSAKETCPFVPGIKKLHFSFPDPKEALALPREESLKRVREIRDMIKRKVEDLVKNIETLKEL